MDSQNLSDLLAGAKKGNQNDNLNAEEIYKKALEALNAQNIEEAINLLQTASNMGYADASCEIGLINAVAGNKDVSLDWHRRAAEQGNSYSQHEVAEAEYKAKNYAEATKWYRKAAEQGFPVAMLKLGLCYDQGIYVAEDKAEAVKWFRKLAEMPDVAGQFKAYSKYFSVEETATTIQSMAQYDLGLAYWNGDGVQQNSEEAKKWFKLAADKGYEDAIEKLQEIEQEEVEQSDPDLTYEERKIKSYLDDQVAKHESPALPNARRIKKSAPPFIFKSILFLLGVIAVILVRRMDQMSFQPISEEQALELAQDVKVTIPDQEIHVFGSKETQKLKVGTTVKVLGVFKEKLNKGNSPRVYWTNQYYLLGLPDGTQAYGPLMETALGQKNVLAEGDTAIITEVKKLKKAPDVVSTGKPSRFEYVYTLEGHEEQYALEDLHIYFPQRVAYLAGGLREEKYIPADGMIENMSFGQRAKKFFFYDIRPITKKNGFFLFPKYQFWNEFLLQRWFRSLLIFLAYILEIFLIFRFLGHLNKIKDNIKGAFWFSKHYGRALHGDADACFEVGDACYIGDPLYGVREENMGQAIRWFKKAADKGQGDACARLGHIYETGESVEKDEIEAYKWYEKGHHDNSDCEEGMKRIIGQTLGLIFFTDGVKAEQAGDSAKAFDCYKRGADYGYAKAQYFFGKCYFNGTGTTKNDAVGFSWYKKAAEQGLADAQMMLGACYFQGLGVKADQDEGIKWLVAAAKNGQKNAQDMLDSLKVSY